MARQHPGLTRSLAVLVAVVAVATQALAQTSFVTFESGQVRPLALSPDGTRLFAVNTPDNQLEIFNVGTGGLTQARRRSRSAWSRSRSPALRATRSGSSTTSPTASASSTSRRQPPRVMRTLLVGDEPRDIVFAGHRRQPRVHHDRAPRPAAHAFVHRRRAGRGRSAAHDRRRRPRATSGCSTPSNLGNDARRHAAQDRARSSATRRARSP